MKKQPYIITALISPGSTDTAIKSRTGIERHQRTHAAGIPAFHLTEKRLIAVSIHITANPDPIDPSIPETYAQNAALSHLKAEIAEHYPRHGAIKFKIFHPQNA